MSVAAFEERYLWVGLVTAILLRLFIIHVWLKKRLKPAPVVKLIYYLYSLAFLIVDVIYNFTIGSWLFMEWPRLRYGLVNWEWTFTQRLKRMDDEGGLEGCTIRFKNVLNEIEPGHV
jgi:hypothetical protein